MKIKIKDIEIEAEIYPRKKWKNGVCEIAPTQKAIDSYVEALKSGTLPPPIEIQRVLKEGKEKILPLDGVHRIKAYNEYNSGVKKTKKNKKKDTDNQDLFREEYELKDEIDAVFWKEEVLDYEENKSLLLVRSTFLNLNHGVPLSKENREDLAKNFSDIYLKNFEKYKEDEKNE